MLEINAYEFLDLLRKRGKEKNYNYFSEGFLEKIRTEYVEKQLKKVKSEKDEDFGKVLADYLDSTVVGRNIDFSSTKSGQAFEKWLKYQFDEKGDKLVENNVNGNMYVFPSRKNYILVWFFSRSVYYTFSFPKDKFNIVYGDEEQEQIMSKVLGEVI